MRHWAVGAALLIVAAAGCTDTGVPAPPRPVEEPGRPGGTFRQGLARVTSLDPAQASTVSERVLADQLYDGLTSWDPVNATARPAVARSWRAEDGNKRWTFEIASGAKAVNGEAITAGDVKATFEQMARSAGPSADLLSPITGFQTFLGDPAVGGISGITTPDPSTVIIQLDSPIAELPLLFGNPAFGIKHFPAGGAEPVGTGPFAVAEQGDSGLRLVKGQGSTALLDGIETKFFPDLEAAYGSFDRGELDWVPVAPGRAVEAGRKYGSHLFRPSLRTLYLSINTQNPKYSDPRFRQAIIRAIDRPAVVRVAEGDVRPLNGVSADAVPDAERSLCGTPCAFDPAASRALLKDLFPNGPPPPVVIDVVAGPPFTDNIRSRIVGDLAAVGITADVRFVPADQFGGAVVAEGREVVQTGWSAAYPSAEAFLPPLFLSSSRANVSNFRDAEIDRRLLEAQSNPDRVRREIAFSDIEDDVLAAVPLLPLAQFPVASVATPAVRGLAVRPTGNFDASVVWLDRPA